MSLTSPSVLIGSSLPAGRTERWIRSRSISTTLALGAVASAVIELVRVLNVVDWTAAQGAAVSAESVGLVAFFAALLAHFRLGTAKEPVAVAGAFTTLVTVTLALGSVFSWWKLTQEQNSAVVGVLAALIGLGSAALVRSQVSPVNPTDKLAGRI